MTQTGVRLHSTRALNRCLHVAAFATIWTHMACPVAAQGQPEQAPISLPQLEQLALEHNPTIAQAESAIDAAKARARQAGMLPNPTIGYSADEVSGGPIIRGGEHGVFVEQTIPLGGKLRLSRQIFEREAEQASLVRDMQRTRVVNTVRVAFYAALAAQRRVDVRERLARLASEATSVSSQLYNVGAADKPDLLASEIEDRQNSLELASARNASYRAWLTLAAAVGDPAMAPRRLIGTLDASVPELDRETALTAILDKSPQLGAARSAVERARAALTRARREPVPDLVVRGGPRYNRELLENAPGGRREPVGWEGAFDVGLTVPLFNRNQGGIAAAEADMRRAQLDVQRLELSLRSQFALAFEEYLSAIRMAETYQRDVIPRAEQAYQLYLARYQEMGAAYPQVLIAQRELFGVSDRYVISLERVWRAAVQIQGFLLTGGLDAPPAPGELIEIPAMQPGGASTNIAPLEGGRQ